MIFAPANTAATAARDLARRIYDGLAKGTIDRSLLTPAASAYFSQEVLSDYAASLGPLGTPTEFAEAGESLRGGMTIRSYRIRAGKVLMDLTTMTLPDGRLDQVHHLARRLVLHHRAGHDHAAPPSRSSCNRVSPKRFCSMIE